MCVYVTDELPHTFLLMGVPPHSQTGLLRNGLQTGLFFRLSEQGVLFNGSHCLQRVKASMATGLGFWKKRSKPKTQTSGFLEARTIPQKRCPNLHHTMHPAFRLPVVVAVESPASGPASGPASTMGTWRRWPGYALVV